jgi:hypothetical protein
MHYQRWVKYGDPDIVLVPRWGGTDVGYNAVHERLNRYRGRANTHECEHCGKPAKDWAYIGGCPDERYHEKAGALLAYSVDPNRYVPLCKPCHARLDDNYPRKHMTL